MATRSLMKTTKLLPLMAAAVGASIALAPSDAKALTVSFDLVGAPQTNNSINGPTNTKLNLGTGTTVDPLSVNPAAATPFLQDAIAGFTGIFTTTNNIFVAASTPIFFGPYTTPTGATLTFAPATTNLLKSGTNALAEVNGWAFTIAGGGVPAGSTGLLNLVFGRQGSSTFSLLADGSLNIPSAGVPGPLPLLGAGAAFGWSRRLRKRLAAGTSQA